ncbi:MAG: Gmad2 immunoglobulin-like domain-containing protein [Bacillota bacterium]
MGVGDVRYKVLVVSALILSLVLRGCGTKDLVSLAGLDQADLYVGDRYGNKIKIDDPQEFLKAFKAAKFVKDPKNVKSETEADYVFYSGDKKIYYDAQGKYLIFIDSDGKHVYSADMDILLAEIEYLPPAVSVGFENEELDRWMEDLCKVQEPAALLFEGEQDCVLVVVAGEKPTNGYSMSLEHVTVEESGIVVSVRLVPPQGQQSQVVTYPYVGFTISKKADLSVELIVPGKTGDQIFKLPVAHVSPDQRVILLKPAQGSILTESVKMAGFARVGQDTLIIEVEDGHNVLGIEQVTAFQEGDGEWRYFEFWMDLEAATSPYGSIICVTYSTPDGTRVEELLVPVGFGAK